MRTEDEECEQATEGFVAGSGDVSSPFASRRSSALGVQRQVICDPLPMIPSVRKNSHTPHARNIATTIVARRTPSEKLRVSAAQATRTGATTGGSA